MLSYLINWDTAGIVLITALSKDQLGGNVVPTATVRAGGSRRRGQVIALQINTRESLLRRAC